MKTKKAMQDKKYLHDSYASSP